MNDASKSELQTTGAKEIDVKTAAHLAYQFFVELFPTLKSSNVLLEEVEEDESGRYWYITLGFDMTVSPQVPAFGVGIQEMFRPKAVRRYKIFTIDKTGKVKSMKIREIE